MGTPVTNQETQIDVAISTASQDVELAGHIAAMLKRRGLRVYFYVHDIEQTLGFDLKTRLREIYGTASMVIAICSKAYDTEYTRLEQEAAFAGRAGVRGLIPVKVDSAAIPPVYQDLTYWDLQEGTTGLVHAISRRFKKQSLSTPAWLMLATLITIGFYSFFLNRLGFNQPSRMPDLLFFIAGGMPAIWVLLFRLGPPTINRLRSRRKPPLQQVVLERHLDTLGPYFAWLFGMTLILFGGYGYQRSRDLKVEANSLETLSRDLTLSFEEYYRDFALITTLAARSNLENDTSVAQQITIEFEEAVDRFSLTGARLRRRSENAALLSASESTKKFLEKTVALERIADRNIGYQIRELARTSDSFPSQEMQRRNRALKKKMLADWNGHFFNEMMDCQEKFRGLQGDLEMEIGAFRNQWQSILR